MGGFRGRKSSNLSVLGARATCVRVKGRHPIVCGTTSEAVERVEPDPHILARRESLGLDYGKLDYVVVDGQAILLDANKTVGCSSKLLGNTEMRELRRYRAEALYDYFDSRRGREAPTG